VPGPRIGPSLGGSAVDKAGQHIIDGERIGLEVAPTKHSTGLTRRWQIINTFPAGWHESGFFG